MDTFPDPLAAEPVVLTEIRIGYARISTREQKLDRQMDALTAAGCRRIFADTKSGRTDERPELKACHAFLNPGDTLVVPSLDRYGRSLQDLVTMVADLRTREIGFTSLHEKLDTTTPRRAPGLPRLRRLGRVDPRAHRGRHPRRAGRRSGRTTPGPAPTSPPCRRSGWSCSPRRGSGPSRPGRT